MKPESVISDLLMKCDEKGIELPEVSSLAAQHCLGRLSVGAADMSFVMVQNSWQALREAITAIRNTKHAFGYVQIPEALDQLQSKFGAAGASAGTTETAAVAPAPRAARRQTRTLMQDMPKSKRRNFVAESDSSSDASIGPSGLIDAMSPVASSKKKKYAKKSRIQEQVEATPAAREENQPLVDKLVQLGTFEMQHGHTQRGLARLRAAKEIRDSRMVITSGAQAKQLERVGQSAATKIDQLLNEGLVAALKEYEVDSEALPVTL
jgi:hypothetical protein